MTSVLYQSFWFMLPAIVANITPIVLARFRLFESLAIPLSHKYLGENKTWRGLLGGILFGVLTVLFQWYIEPQFPSKYILFEYRVEGLLRSLLLGFLLSFGILGTDMVKSFFKRKMGISPGKSWPLFDQIDSWGALFLSMVIVRPGLHTVVILLGGPLIHMILNRIGYFFRLKKVWW